MIACLNDKGRQGVMGKWNDGMMECWNDGIMQGY